MLVAMYGHKMLFTYAIYAKVVLICFYVEKLRSTVAVKTVSVACVLQDTYIKKQAIFVIQLN